MVAHMFNDGRGWAPGLTCGPVFMAGCFRRIAKTSVADIVSLKGLGVATKYQSTTGATDELNIWRVLTNTSARLYRARRGDEPGNGRVKVQKGEETETMQ